MNLCSDKHDEICYENEPCPICELKIENNNLEEELNSLQKEFDFLQEELDSLKSEKKNE